jgi:imidazolonepropionase
VALRLFHNARITTPRDPGHALSGAAQGRVESFESGALLVEDGLVAAVGPEADVRGALAGGAVEEIDCGGRALTPGFVDPHTHMCFATLREEEFSLRLEGVEYLEILRRGGGILSSVRAVREAGEEALVAVARANAMEALAHGTTTVEMKSGYGLDTENELKLLRAIRTVGQTTPLDVVATFLGAHAVPPEFADRPEAYVDLVVDEMIPAVAEQGIARFVDVFCESGVFTVEQSRRILSAGKAAGLRAKLHADEVHDMGGGALAAELGAVSADHLLAVSPRSLEAMAEAGTIAVLLPGTAYSLRKPYAEARAMVERGVPVALATDCNPGSSYVRSMQFVVGLAVMAMGLTPEEALVASTLNAAYALDLADRVGSLDPGKQADFCLLDGHTPAIFAYRAGGNSVARVVKRGVLVHPMEGSAT